MIFSLQGGSSELRRVISGIAVFWLLLAGGSAFAGEIAAPQPGFSSNPNGVIPKSLVLVPDADPIGNRMCFKCHPLTPSEAVLSSDVWKMDVHSKIKGTQDCESCHGNGSEHARLNNDTGIIEPLKMSKADQNALCQACHMQGEALFHGTANISCLDCHRIHTVKNPKMLSVLPERELCYRCHARARAEFNMYSHHPVNEGEMACTDCHAAHFSSRLDAEKGSPEILGNRASIESCGACHPQEAGPYVTSPSALEGCLGCHKPHGGPVDYLEKMPEPALCIKCHEPSSHQFVELGTRCTECHMDIHGSDHDRELFN